MPRTESTTDLYNEARRALGARDYRRALELGGELEQHRHIAAFEVMGRAHCGLNQLDKAIEVLERGVKLAPGAAPLWCQLGCYYSDATRFDDAHLAFARAHEARGGIDPTAALNEAIVYLRQKQPDQALSILDAMPDGAADVPPLVRLQYRTDALLELERFAEVVAACDTLLDDPQQRDRLGRSEPSGLGPDQHEDAELLSSLHFNRGLAIWKSSHDAAAAARDAREAVRLQRSNKRALWLLREAEGQASESATLHHLVLNGERTLRTPAGKPKRTGFAVTYQVLADDADEAFRLAKALEPPEVQDSLYVDECEPREAYPKDPKGVYEMSGYVFFPLEG